MESKLNLNVNMALDKWYKFLTLLGVPLIIVGLFLMLKANEMHRTLWREWLINSNNVVYKQKILIKKATKIDELINSHISTGSQLYFEEQLAILGHAKDYEETDETKVMAKVNIENIMRNTKEIEDMINEYSDEELKLQLGDVSLVLHDFEAIDSLIKKYSNIGYLLFVTGVASVAFGLSTWHLFEKRN